MNHIWYYVVLTQGFFVIGWSVHLQRQQPPLPAQVIALSHLWSLQDVQCLPDLIFPAAWCEELAAAEPTTDGISDEWMSDIGLTSELFGMEILVALVAPAWGIIAGRTWETCAESERILVISLWTFVVLTSVTCVPIRNMCSRYSYTR